MHLLIIGLTRFLGDQSCHHLAQNCTECLPCLRCTGGLLPVNGVCVDEQDTSPCLSAADGQCTACVDGYALIGDEGRADACVTCQHTGSLSLSNCRSCAFLDGALQCLSCTPGFSLVHTTPSSGAALWKCVSQGAAEQAESVHAYGSGAATTCTVENCSQCLSTALDVCVVCVTGYVLKENGKKCVCDIEHCSKCSDTNGQYCAVCNDNHALTKNRKCTCSVPRCIECGVNLKAASPTCVRCATGYTLSADGTECSCSVANCASCDAEDGRVCNTCIQNYALSFSRRKCTCSVYNCKECFPLDGKQCMRCVAGYMLSTNYRECTQSIVHCLYASPSNGTICSVCNIGYTPAYDGLICLVTTCKILYCEECIGATCRRCRAGYMLLENRLECVCDSPNCLLCDLDNGKKCSRCVGGYELDATGLCQCTIKNCARCTSDGKSCLECINGYKKADLECICSVDFCSVCDPQNGQLCTKCDTNYVINSQGICTSLIPGCVYASDRIVGLCLMCRDTWIAFHGRCLCVVSNCDVCAEEGTTCIRCKKGFKASADNNKCECSVEHCAECDPEDGTKCLACSVGYMLTADTNSCTSTSCSIENCKKCSETTTPACSVCNNNYQMSTTSDSCKCLIPNCKTCRPSNGQQCLECEKGYQRSKDMNQCLCAVPFCETCEPNDGERCQKCVHNFFQSPTKGSCTCAARDCLVCALTDGNRCDVCGIGYTLQNSGTCTGSIPHCDEYILTKGCHTCLPNYSLSPSNLACSCAVQNCQECDDNNGAVCKICRSNFQQVGGMCPCRINNCIQCDSTDGSVCLSCNQNYVLSTDRKTCACAVENCQTCALKNGKACILCNVGYRLTQKAACEKIACTAENCVSCAPNTLDKCIVCVQGYVLDLATKECKCKDPNCEMCSKRNGAICSNCKLDYIKTASGKCSCGRTYCERCNPENGSICEKCMTGYQLTSEHTCIPHICFPDQDNCRTCGRGMHENSCVRCSTGYALLNGSCTRSSEQQICTESNGVCTDCAQTYYLWQNGCYPCSFIPNCMNCTISPEHGPLCNQCQPQYALMGGRCQIIPYCSQGCLCNDALQCLECTTGYIMIAGVCTSCESLFYMCAECSETFCLRCYDGYSIALKVCVLSTCEVGKNGCAACANEFTCALCEKGRHFYRGACKSCSFSDANCEECTFTDRFKCTRCANGYAEVEFDGESLCLKCTGLDNCLRCRYNASMPLQFQCTTCASPWLVNRDTGRCSLSTTRSPLRTSLIAMGSLIVIAAAIATVVLVMLKCRKKGLVQHCPEEGSMLHSSTGSSARDGGTDFCDTMNSTNRAS